MKNSWKAPSNTALLRVDIQKTFCPGGGLAVNDGDKIVPVVNALSRHFNLAGDSQDWHPVGHKSFASTHGAAPFSEIDMPYGKQTLWPDHGIQNTEDAMFHPDLERGAKDFLVRKGTNAEIDSYSAFYENDRTTQPLVAPSKEVAATLKGRGVTLTAFFKAEGVKRIVMAGLAYDFCVGWTALDAVRDGFSVIVVKDATRSIDLGGSEAAMTAALQKAGVRVLPSSQLRNALKLRIPGFAP